MQQVQGESCSAWVIGFLGLSIAKIFIFLPTPIKVFHRYSFPDIEQANHCANRQVAVDVSIMGRLFAFGNRTRCSIPSPSPSQWAATKECCTKTDPRCH
jgi:hypothetical protein